MPALNSCVSRARSLVQAFREQTSSPGLVVAVSVDGRLVWSEGFGYADVENGVPCSPDTVMRIASISKPLTATAVGENLLIKQKNGFLYGAVRVAKMLDTLECYVIGFFLTAFYYTLTNFQLTLFNHTLWHSPQSCLESWFTQILICSLIIVRKYENLSTSTWIGVASLHPIQGESYASLNWPIHCRVTRGICW